MLVEKFDACLMSATFSHGQEHADDEDTRAVLKMVFAAVRYDDIGVWVEVLFVKVRTVCYEVCWI